MTRESIICRKKTDMFTKGHLKSHYPTICYHRIAPKLLLIFSEENIALVYTVITFQTITVLKKNMHGLCFELIKKFNFVNAS